MHCHLSGSIENIWTPLWRWMAAGIGGLAFVFGAYRTGSTWINRKPWKPLWARAVEWVDDRFDIVKPTKKVLEKPVPLFATRWMYCLGGITFTLFGIQAITGILLAFFYKPTPEAAYQSILFIENQVRFGAAIRSIHHWSANGMVVMVIAHMVRVFIHGAFKAPRELNWVSGVLLLILTLAFGLTGYLLPWDQRAYWATTVASEIAGGIPQIGDVVMVFLRGGWDVTAVTLSRFYALHVIALPVFILLLLGAHFLMVRRQGIKEPL
jgi:quinol-cytochrome oxidoreductase complex cytochrome b subunit